MISGRSSLQGAYGTKVVSALSRKPGGQSQLSAAFTLIKCNWGIGMMGMPYMLDQAGTIAGVIMFVASMALTQLSIDRLLEVDAELLRQHRLRKRSVAAAAIGSAAKRTSAPAAAGLTQPLWATDDSDSADLDYAGIMQRSLGGIGEWLAIASIVVSAWGSCIAYLKFISDNGGSLCRLCTDPTCTACSITTWGWVLVAAGPLAALAILDDVRFLAPASVVGLGSAFAFACVVVAGAFSHLSGEDVAHFFHTEPHVKWQTLPLAMSIAAFCNEGIVILTPSTRNSMRRPERFLHVSGWSIVFFTVCYMAVGVCGNICYAGHVAQELAANFNDTTVNNVATVLYCLQLVPTYAVVYFCAYESVELKLLRRWQIERFSVRHRQLKLRMVLVRWFWLALSGLIALVVPHFGAYLGVIGALATSLAIYVLPHVAWLKECSLLGGGALRSAGLPLQQEGVAGRANLVAVGVSCVVTAFGCALAVVGTVQSVQAMLQPSAAAVQAVCGAPAAGGSNSGSSLS